MIDNITGTLYPSAIPPITSLELLADTAFMVITASGDLRKINRTEMYTNMAALGLKGNKGDKGDIGNRGPAGPQGVKGDAGPIGPQGPAGQNGTQGPAGANGANGWVAITAIESRGNDQVIKVVDWTGGGGTKPTVGIYVSPTGFTSDVNLAANIRGAKGDKGDAGTNGAVGTNGWSPLLRIQVDSGSKFLYVYDWIGGTGVKPTTIGFVTETGISNTASSGGFDYDVSSQLDLLNVRVDDVNVRLVSLEDSSLNFLPFANSIYFTIINMTTLTPPTTVDEGDTYIIPVNATGDWANRFGYVAHLIDGAWTYYEPVNGYLVYDKGTKDFYVYNGTAWVDTQKTVKDSLATKVDKEVGKSLSTNDFTTAFRDKLESLTQVNVVDDLTSTSVTDALSANQGKVLNDLITALTLRVDNLETP